jgi:hypothetical protein
MSWSFLATASFTFSSRGIAPVRFLPCHPPFILQPSSLQLTLLLVFAELNSTLASLTEAETKDASVSHALAVRLAATQGNYTKFFRLFNAAPKMGAYLMDHFVPRERVTALVTMTKACVLPASPLPSSRKRIIDR